jgi:hypothetical protein
MARWRDGAMARPRRAHPATRVRRDGAYRRGATDGPRGLRRPRGSRARRDRDIVTGWMARWIEIDGMEAVRTARTHRDDGIVGLRTVHHVEMSTSRPVRTGHHDIHDGMEAVRTARGHRDDVMEAVQTPRSCRIRGNDSVAVRDERWASAVGTTRPAAPAVAATRGARVDATAGASTTTTTTRRALVAPSDPPRCRRSAPGARARGCGPPVRDHGARGPPGARDATRVRRPAGRHGATRSYDDAM